MPIILKAGKGLKHFNVILILLVTAETAGIKHLTLGPCSLCPTTVLPPLSMVKKYFLPLSF